MQAQLKFALASRICIRLSGRAHFRTVAHFISDMYSTYNSCRILVHTAITIFNLRQALLLEAKRILVVGYIYPVCTSDPRVKLEIRKLTILYSNACRRRSRLSRVATVGERISRLKLNNNIGAPNLPIHALANMARLPPFTHHHRRLRHPSYSCQIMTTPENTLSPRLALAAAGF
jgi:hypothetical protein